MYLRAIVMLFLTSTSISLLDLRVVNRDSTHLALTIDFKRLNKLLPPVWCSQRQEANLDNQLLSNNLSQELNVSIQSLGSHKAVRRCICPNNRLIGPTRRSCRKERCCNNSSSRQIQRIWWAKCNQNSDKNKNKTSTSLLWDRKSSQYPFSKEGLNRLNSKLEHTQPIRHHQLAAYSSQTATSTTDSINLMIWRDLIRLTTVKQCIFQCHLFLLQHPLHHLWILPGNRVIKAMQ